MKLLPFKLLALAGLAIVASASPCAAAADAPEIQAVESAQEAAWNAHDAHAYMDLFTADAVLINVLGWQWNGREEAEQKLGRAFEFVFAESKLHIDAVKVRTLSPDLALAYVSWTMVGAKSPDGSGAGIPQHGIQTQLLRKADGRWLILSFQNTNAVPERPFPIVEAQAPANPPAAQPANAVQPVQPAQPVPPAQPARRCLLADHSGKCLIRK